MPAERKRERIYLRLDASAKKKIEQAAALEQKTVTSFILSSAMESAERIVKAHKKIVLSDRDWNAFFEALVDPPKPNQALLSGMAIEG